jgi:hypothetical protein
MVARRLYGVEIILMDGWMDGWMEGGREGGREGTFEHV